MLISSVRWVALNVNECGQNSHVLLYIKLDYCKIIINIQRLLPIMKVTLSHGYNKRRG
jgi:hypothetical protein